jgi:hypothetical protein
VRTTSTWVAGPKRSVGPERVQLEQRAARVCRGD